LATPNKGGFFMFLKRLISGVVLLLILLLFNYLGGTALFLLMAALSLKGLYEFYNATGIAKKKALLLTGFIFGLIYSLCLYFRNFLSYDPKLPVIICFLIVTGAVFVFAFPKYTATELFTTFFGMVYTVVTLQFVYLTRELSFGSWVVWLIYISSWGCDTCAYCAGRLLGKHKLAPVLSPHKSVEGAIGGVLGSSLIGALYGLACANFTDLTFDLVWIFAIVCGVGAIISQIGDLTASGIKRNFNIKDYGRLIPGHGGVLDRFDSVIITAPIIYYLALFML